MAKQRKEEILSKTYFKQNSSFETFIIALVLFVFLPIISFRCDWFPLDLSPEWVVDIGKNTANQKIYIKKSRQKLVRLNKSKIFFS